MTPTIRSGDRVTVEPLRTTPRTGDVLACKLDGRLVIHRMVGRLEDCLEARGDVAPASDRPLSPGEVLGAVVRVERRGRPVLFGLGSERILLAWLSRLGLLRAAARWRERLRSGRLGSGVRLVFPVPDPFSRGVRP
jgi:hypothetical protein